MTKAVEKWFRPKGHTGWHKTQSSVTRRRHLLDHTDKRLSRHGRYLQAARRAQALANVTQDPETAKKARTDALYFYAKARGVK